MNAVADAGISLKLICALGDITSKVSDPKIRSDRGRQLLASCAGKMEEGDLDRLRRPLAFLEAGFALENKVGELR